MIKELLLILFLFILFSSCDEKNDMLQSEDILQTTDSTNTIVLSPQEYSALLTLTHPSSKYSEEEVLEILKHFEGDKYSYANLKPIVRKGLSKSTANVLDTALYIADLGENNGWAVVSADVRLPNAVLAYSDQGSIESINNEDFSYFMDFIINYYDSCVVNFENQKDSLVEVVLQKSDLEISDTSSVCMSKKQNKFLSEIQYTNLCRNEHQIING
jgi:hypothetical protein